jgi:hypothetical protein
LNERVDSYSPDSVRKKQKFKNILTIIGESLDSYFKAQIFENIGEKPTLISIKDVNSIEKGTSKSKVHFVTYYLNTDIGEQLINLVVKFAADEVRYNKEIRNYGIISEATERFPGIYIPKIVYKSHQNRSIIYEGITGKSFRETQLDKNFKHQLAGQTLSSIHGIETDNFATESYKKLILYLLSILNDTELESEILELMLPSFLSLEKSLGSTLIHGDFHQGNLLFSSDATTAGKEIMDEFPPKIKVYIIDPEFIMPGRDRAEDIGTFFAKPLIKEFQKYGTFDETKKDIDAFIKGYNFALSKMGADFALQDLYSAGLTIDFHVSAYILYDISDKIENKKMKIEDEDMQLKIKLLKQILSDKLMLD